MNSTQVLKNILEMIDTHNDLIRTVNNRVTELSLELEAAKRKIEELEKGAV